MGATFTRVNGVLVDVNQTVTDAGRYPHPQFQGTGSYSAAAVPVTSPTAGYGACWRGMPIGLDLATGFLVPISASGAVYAGVLTDDLTTHLIAGGTKVTFAKRGRVRSYAGGALTIGDPVKADVSANFSGFVKWVAGTDAVDLLRGHAFPLDDGSASNGASAATSMVQGDTIFVDLIGF